MRLQNKLFSCCRHSGLNIEPTSISKVASHAAKIRQAKQVKKHHLHFDPEFCLSSNFIQLLFNYLNEKLLMIIVYLKSNLILAKFWSITGFLQQDLANHKKVMDSSFTRNKNLI